MKRLPSIALGSSVQVALLVIPATVFLSYAIGNPITLTFDVRQLLALGLAALIVPTLVSDGESTWIEGLQLIALYAVLARDTGLSVTAVTNELAWARRVFREIVLERLRAICASDEEFRAEARDLLGVDVP